MPRRMIDRAPDIREELYASETPAHAHDVLHAEETEDSNYCLAE